MWGLRQGLTMLLLALVAAAAWWLLEGRPRPAEPSITRERTPDYVVVELDAVETNADGKPARLMIAQQLRQYVDEDLAELELPRLTIIQPDSPPWTATAKRGLLLSGGDEVRLIEDVRIRRAATADSAAARLTTSRLTIWPKREYAEGDQPVQIESDLDWITGEGIKLWYSEPKHAEIAGRARIFLVPDDDRNRTTEEPRE